MRGVTRAEALLVQELLAGVAEGSLTRAIARRTRQTARQRLYVREWVRDRYVPDFAALGRPLLTFAIAAPFSEELFPTLQRWRAQPENVLLWAGTSAVFGVFASPPRPTPPPWHTALFDTPAFETCYVLLADARNASVPVFFDFEAAWVNAVGLPGAVSYPQPVPRGSHSSGAEEEDPLSPSERAAAMRLVMRPFVPQPPGGPSAPSGGILVGMADRRCLREGRVAFRSFLDPSAVARSITGFPGQCVLLHGSLRAGAHPAGLFHALVSSTAARPFLFATDGQQLLMAALAAPGLRHDGAAPSAATPAMEVVQRFLSHIVVHREPLDALQTVVDHRYDRLFDERLIDEDPVPLGLQPIPAEPESLSERDGTESARAAVPVPRRGGADLLRRPSSSGP
jgi:hypothetical protein